MLPEVSIRPIRLAACSVNHNAPSAAGPFVIWYGPLPAVGRANSVTTPAVVIRPDLVASVIDKPQVAVRTRRDAPESAVRRWNREFSNNTRGCDPSNFAGVLSE